MSKSHHFCGLDQYSQQLMDLAEGKQVFTGRWQKLSNRQVLDEIASVKACNVKRRVDFIAPFSTPALGLVLVACMSRLLRGEGTSWKAVRLHIITFMTKYSAVCFILFTLVVLISITIAIIQLLIIIVLSLSAIL